MKKLLLILVLPLLMGAGCSNSIQKSNNISNSNINEPPVSKAIDSTYCFSDDLVKCLDKLTKVTGTFDKNNLRLTSVIWGEEFLGNLKLTQSKFTKENTYSDITDGIKITVKGNIVKLDNNYAISSSILLVDRHPGSLKCDSSFECYIKDIDCSANVCGGPAGGNSEASCIKGECGCKCVYRMDW